MKSYETFANVLIYSLVLVNLALILALAMFNNFFVFVNNTEGTKIDKKLSSIILGKWSLSAKYALTMNTNGSGIIDVIGCPQNVTMSGDTILSTTDSELLYSSGTMYCSASHNWTPYYINFNPNFTGFSWASYFQDALNIDEFGFSDRNFIDSDNTRIDISAGLPTSPDWIDDNFNSDNYRISSSGTLLFPWEYVDDDVFPRTRIYGYIPPQSEYSNIFWSNTQVQNYIENNPNNEDSYFQRLWSLNDGVLYIDADRDFDMKILQFDKSRYDSTSELVIVTKEETEDIPASIWYIQNNTWELSLTWSITGNEYIFDFMANDYAVFINNSGTGVLTYVLTAENSSWSWVYINALDDSREWSIAYLWAEIIQDMEKNYIGKIFEVTNKK